MVSILIQQIQWPYLKGIAENHYRRQRQIRKNLLAMDLMELLSTPENPVKCKIRRFFNSKTKKGYSIKEEST